MHLLHRLPNPHLRKPIALSSHLAQQNRIRLRAIQTFRLAHDLIAVEVACCGGIAGGDGVVLGEEVGQVCGFWEGEGAVAAGYGVVEGWEGGEGDRE